MSNSTQRPPVWISRFLHWYCNPELIEEIQGDALELYHLRLATEGKRAADWKYVRDVLRFFRFSNIRRTGKGPGYNGLFWTLNFRLAWRSAGNNLLIFCVKIFGLAACLAFALTLAVYVTGELTYDRHHADHGQLWRLGSKAEMPQGTTNYAVSPMLLAPSIAAEVPVIETATRVKYHGYPAFVYGEDHRISPVCNSTDSSFLRMFHFDFLAGGITALDAPRSALLTESVAKQLFSDEDPLGKVLQVGDQQIAVTVTAVIADMPANTHLRFDVMVSWDTFRKNEAWDNINAYTYIQLKNGVAIDQAKPLIDAFAKEHEHEVTHNYEEVKYSIIYENIADIHLSPILNEDIAVKGSRNNTYILLAVSILFLLIGLINYLNLTLAELASSLKKIGILRIFGGLSAGSTRVAISDTLFNMIVALPATVLLVWLSWKFTERYFSIDLSLSTLKHPLLLAGGLVFFVFMLLTTKLNGYVLSRTRDLASVLKGRLNSVHKGLRLREILVASQLSFSMIMLGIIFIFIDQFQFLNTADKGFNDKNVLAISMWTDSYSKAVAFQDEVLNLSGVRGTASTSFFPGSLDMKYIFKVEGAGMEQKLINYMSIGYDFIHIMEMQLLGGRNFDKERSTDLKGAYIINEAAAREFGWIDPIGKKIEGPIGTDGREGVVIGVVRDFNFMSLHEMIEPVIMFVENPDWGVNLVYVKTDDVAGPELLSRIETAYHKSFGDAPFDFSYLDLKYASLYEDDERVRRVVEVGLIASILFSSLGVFSISALLVLARTKEMGIRKVIGASLSGLLANHIKTFVRFLIIAVVLAVPGIFYFSSSWLNGFAYHVALHVWHFLVPVVVSVLIIAITIIYHGVRIARISPIDVLKEE